MTTRANTAWDHEQAQSTVMARLEAGAVVSAAERYARGLAALDAALAGKCPDCGGQLETVRDFGATLVQCQNADCFWCRSVSEGH